MLFRNHYTWNQFIWAFSFSSSISSGSLMDAPRRCSPLPSGSRRRCEQLTLYRPLQPVFRLLFQHRDNSESSLDPLFVLNDEASEARKCTLLNQLGSLFECSSATECKGNQHEKQHDLLARNRIGIIRVFLAGTDRHKIDYSPFPMKSCCGNLARRSEPSLIHFVVLKSRL